MSLELSVQPQDVEGIAEMPSASLEEIRHEARLKVITDYFNNHLTIDSKETPSSYAIKQIEKYYAQYLRWREVAKSNVTRVEGMPSLQRLAINSLITALKDDRADGAAIVAISLAPNQLNSFINDPRLHYTAFRIFHGLENSSQQEALERLQANSVDEWVHKNEKWIRDSESMEGLLTLNDWQVMWPVLDNAEEEGVKIITRQKPPRKGFACLDAHKAIRLPVVVSTELYIKTFHEYTGGLFDGLDWENVAVAGGMTLNVLLRLDDKNADIDIYLYGMTVEESNKKVEHIYDVWRKNLPEDTWEDILVVRNMKTVNFIPAYPHRRVQIILKLNKSPAEVLLNFDLDPCAMAFTGNKLYLLPRAARSIETGYTIFTMSLIYGHHLSSRRASQDSRVFKYADRGFGIFILPEYCEQVSFDTRYRGGTDAVLIAKDAEGVDNQREAAAGGDFEYAQKIEHPTVGSFAVTGLRGLKMIEYIASDMVHRFCVGQTKYNTDMQLLFARSDEEKKIQRQYKLSSDGPTLGVFPKGPSEYPDVPNRLFDEVPIKIGYYQLDQRKQHLYLPGGRKCLGGFELFMRHVALWNLQLAGKVEIIEESYASNEYDETEYADYVDLPGYTWNADFQRSDYLEKLTEMNENLYAPLTCRHLLSPSRLLQRTINAENPVTLSEMLEQDIAIPLVVPQELENYCRKIVQDLQSKDSLSIRIDAALIGDATDSLVNFQEFPYRLWIVSKEFMWAKIDRKLDEVFEMLSVFYRLQQNTHIIEFGFEEHSNVFVEALDIMHHRRPNEQEANAEPLPRLRKPGNSYKHNLWSRDIMDKRPHLKKTCAPVASLLVQYNNTAEMTWPSPYEIKSFNEWLMDEPSRTQRTYTEYPLEGYDEWDNRFLPEMRDYWGPEDELQTAEDKVWWGIAEKVPTKTLLDIYKKEAEGKDAEGEDAEDIIMDNMFDPNKRKREESFYHQGHSKPQSGEKQARFD